MNITTRSIWAATFAGIIFFGVVVIAFAGQEEELFAQAVKRYQAGDYVKAVDLNERLLNEMGVESPAVYFNLGNSYFKQGKLGRAILAFLRAKMLAPRDADIKQNLSFARQSVERYDGVKKTQDNLHFFSIFRFLSDGELKWFVVLTMMAMGIFFLAVLYAGLPRKRLVLLTVVLFVSTLYILLGYASRYIETQGSAVVLKKAEARFEPTDQATVYFNVSEGEELKIIRQNDGWAKVQREDGRQGWVQAKCVGVI